MLIVCCLFVVRWLLFVVCCWLCVGCCLYVVCSSWFGALVCSWFVVCCMLCVSAVCVDVASVC